MMDNKLLSIIIPVYNGKKYLRECVESILNSSYNNIEILLIDDGSEKTTKQLCDDLAKQNSKIKTFHKENGGIVSSRNYGLSVANGEYIAFSDQDDITNKNMYEICINRIEKDNADLCICGCDKKYNNSYQDFITINENSIIQGKEDIEKEIIVPLLCKCNRIQVNYSNQFNNICNKYYGYIWNAVYKTQIIRDNNIQFMKFVNYEDDHLFMLDYLKKCTSISFEKYKGYFWRIYNTSTSHSTKFVDNVDKKRKQLTNYYISILEQCVKKEDLKIYKEKFYIRDMVQIIENETLPSNPKKNKESIKYLNEVFQNIIIERNVDLKKKEKRNRKAFRDEYIQYCLGRHSMKYIFYMDKYIYNKILEPIKEKLRMLIGVF